jgi:uncharacterized Zn finger protein
VPGPPAPPITQPPITQPAITQPPIAQPPITEDTLLRLAGEIYFDRGLDYYEEGRVRSVAVDAAKVTGTVEGTWSYQVTLRRTGARLDGSCTCPVGQSGGFCKHCVALGLAWLEAGEPGGGEAEPALRPFLDTLDHAVLVDLLADAAEHDPRVAAQVRQLRARKEVESAGPEPAGAQSGDTPASASPSAVRR